MSGIRLSMRVWDAPTRLFHWLIVVLIAVSYASVKTGHMEIHFLSGYSVLTLLLFRIVWGFIGSDTARFARFLGSPLTGLRYLLRFARREPDNQIGHNAAGGWMVMILLLLLATQVGTGLFSNDDIISEGPLAKFVTKATSDLLRHWHERNWKLLLIFGGLHIVVVFAYAIVKRQDLVRPMITGRKRLPAAMRAPRMANPLLALVVLLIAAGVVWAFVNFV